MATAAATSTFISVARLLPPRLTRFFARYPPGTANDVRSNPFKPTVFSATGKWHNPVFSLRRQAELCKLARKYGVEELLPPTKKSSIEREVARQRRAENGLRVRGHREERTLKARYVLYAKGGRIGRDGWCGGCWGARRLIGMTGSKCGNRLWRRCPPSSRNGNGGVMEEGGRSGRVGRRSSRWKRKDTEGAKSVYYGKKLYHCIRNPLRYMTDNDSACPPLFRPRPVFRNPKLPLPHLIRIPLNALSNIVRSRFGAMASAVNSCRIAKGHVPITHTPANVGSLRSRTAVPRESARPDGPLPSVSATKLSSIPWGEGEV